MKFQDEGPKLRKRYARKTTSSDSSDENEDDASSGKPSDVGSWEFPLVPTQPSSSINPFEALECVAPPMFEPTPENEWDDMLGFGLVSNQKEEEDDFLEMSAEEVFDDPELALGKGYLAEFIKGATRGDGTPFSSATVASTAVGMDVGSPLGWMNLYKMLHYPNLDRNRFYSPQLETSQLFQSFTDSITPGSSTVAPVFRYHGKWLSRLPPMMGNFPLLDTAIRAVTLAHLGMQAQSPMIMRESNPYYGRALHLLNKALLDEKQGLASETLSATILLSFYEMFSSDKNESWVKHAGGAGVLMRIRGASRHRYGFDREMFLAYRHALIIESFEQDKPCFLDEPDWRQVAADIHEDIRASGVVGTGNQIFDLSEEFYREMTKIPSMCYDSRRLPMLSKVGGGEHEDIKADIKRRAKEHRTNLKSIHARFSAILRMIGQAPNRRMTNDPVIATRIDYFNIFVASTHTGYWTILMIVNAILRELDKDSNDAPFYKMENREAALDCCRSTDYMETSSFLGPFFVIFALRLSWNWLEQREEKLWVVERLRRIGERNMSMAKGGLPMIQADPGAQLAQMPKVRAAVEELDLLEKARDKEIALRTSNSPPTV
jgi:Fungal specific transcription factor domain